MVAGPPVEYRTYQPLSSIIIRMNNVPYKDNKITDRLFVYLA